MGKKKPPQLYVYRCIKNQRKNVDFGLSEKKYKIGDFISPLGNPVSSLYEATIVNPKEKDWYDLRNLMADDNGEPDKNKFDEYFEMCCVEITLKQRHEEIGKGRKVV